MLMSLIAFMNIVTRDDVSFYFGTQEVVQLLILLREVPVYLEFLQCHHIGLNVPAELPQQV